MTNSIYGTQIFIGRKQEITEFEALLSSTATDEWLLYLLGEGGVGKTQLLYRFIEIAQKRRNEGHAVLVADGLIDLYWTTNQQELGILRSIASRLGQGNFGSFFAALERYESLYSRSSGVGADIFEERLRQTRNAFFTAYRGLAADHIVLFFDTAENTSDGIRQFWRETLPRLKQEHPGTLIVLAGRAPIPGLPAQDVVTRPVSGFEAGEVDAYLKEYGYHFEHSIIDLITKLSRGRPIFVALTLDWLHVGYSVQELVNCDPPHYERLMIRRVQELHFDEDQAILAMAHLYRRFDAQLLSFILGLSSETAESLVQDVAAFSFVKFRPSTDGQPESCLLHDEMRDLVNKYVWSELDPLSEYRLGWNRRVVAYYEGMIAAHSSILEQQTLSLERLAYWLDVDLDSAFHYSQELFQDARARRDKDFMEAINHEVARVQDRLESTSTAALAYRKALVLRGRNQFEQAWTHLEALIDDSDFDLLQAAVRVELIESLVYGGDLIRAIELGEKWIAWFAAARDKYDLANSTRRRMEFEFGKLCNNLGLAYRNQNKLGQTIEYYEKSLDHFILAGDAHSEIANTKNNLGYVFHRLGRDDEALSQCEAALAIRRRLNSPDQLGYSYNVMAMIYVDQLRQYEAQTYFQRAREAFEEADSQRGRGLVNIAYGRALRQLGRHKERNANEPFNPNRDEYVHALHMLTEAIDIFRPIGDEPNLSEALNEMGTLLRQQRQWQPAIEHFSESMKFAKQVGNLYRHVDNLVDIAITYDYRDDLDQALDYADRASTLALDGASNLQAYNLFAKAQEVRANVLYRREDYDAAFEAIADACVYIMRLDPEKLGESPAKRALYYNEKLDWATEKILNLPTMELVHDKTAFLINRWKDETLGTRRLAESYPGFVIRMQDLDRDFVFLCGAPRGKPHE
jgi:tetratricopeptide (TPR) repeat protein